MSHVVLYRKYRPQRFEEVIGQDHVVKVLRGQVEAARIAHAYLFAGSRGTGKTSVARILAREIGTAPHDIYEIDAASNTGVDDIRALNESVNTLPYDSKYKVYIVDEVHMLSKSAFNALLKTLEEPPRHVIFILATTEPEKLPETVTSRCQSFIFKKPSVSVLRAFVKEVAKKEGFTIEPSCADLVAILSDGSFRDAHGILEKVMSISSDTVVSVEEVETVTGAPRGKIVNDFIEAIAEFDTKKGMRTLESAREGGVDMKILLKLILVKLRLILLLRHAKDLEEKIRGELREEDFDFISKCASAKGSAVNSTALIELLEAHDRLKYAVVPEIPLELALIKITAKKN